MGLVCCFLCAGQTNHGNWVGGGVLVLECSWKPEEQRSGEFEEEGLAKKFAYQLTRQSWLSSEEP